MGFSGGDVNFTIQFIVVLVAVPCQSNGGSPEVARVGSAKSIKEVSHLFIL